MLVHSLPTKNGAALALSSKGTQVAVGASSAITLTSIASFKSIKEIKLPPAGEGGSIVTMDFSADDALLSVLRTDGKAVLVDPKSGLYLRTLAEGVVSEPTIVSSGEGAQYLGTPRIALRRNELVGLFMNNEDGELSRDSGLSGWSAPHTRKVLYAGRATAFARRTDDQFVCGDDDGSLRIVDANSGQVDMISAGSPSTSHLSAHPIGQTAWLSAEANEIKIFDFVSGSVLKRWPVRFKQDNESTLGVMDEGRIVFACGQSGEPEQWGLDLWNTKSGNKVMELNDAKAACYNDRYILAVADAKCQIIDVKTLTASPAASGLETGYHAALALSAPVTVVSGASPVAAVMDTKTGRTIRKIRSDGGYVSAVAISADGQRVLIGSDSGNVELWDVRTGKRVRIFRGEIGGWIHSVSFSRDERYVLSGGERYAGRLWDIASGTVSVNFRGYSAYSNPVKFDPSGSIVYAQSGDSLDVWKRDGELIASLLASEPGRFISITPDGFLGAYRVQSVNVVRGLRTETLSQFAHALYAPDLVREALAGDTGNEVKIAAEALTLAKIWDSGPPPTVAIQEPSAGAIVSGEVIRVRASVLDRGKGVGRVEMRVNGIAAAVIPKLDGNGPEHNIQRDVVLDRGENIIEVVAYNEGDLLASLPAEITVTFAGPTDTVRPKLHVLAIGIDQYRDRGWISPEGKPTGFGLLRLAVNDAVAIGEALKSAGAEVYSEVRVKTVLDREATILNLESVVTQMAAGVHPRDTFLLFAAGHGYSHQGRFYLIPQDYQGGTNPDALAKLAIDQGHLQDWIANRIRAKKSVIFLDTCESGALVAGHTRSRVDVPGSEAAIGRLHEATGRPVLTAAASGKPALEGYNGHGVFTWALLDALRNGDTNGNGTIELSELVAHVQSTVPSLSAELREARAAIALGGTTFTDQTVGQFRQTVRFGSRGEDFVLARRLQ